MADEDRVRAFLEHALQAWESRVVDHAVVRAHARGHVEEHGQARNTGLPPEVDAVGVVDPQVSHHLAHGDAPARLVVGQQSREIHLRTVVAEARMHQAEGDEALRIARAGGDHLFGRTGQVVALGAVREREHARLVDPIPVHVAQHVLGADETLGAFGRSLAPLPAEPSDVGVNVDEHHVSLLSERVRPVRRTASRC